MRSLHLRPCALRRCRRLPAAAAAHSHPPCLRPPDRLQHALRPALCCRFITPPGQGFLPRETAVHHQEWAVRLVQQAMAEAGLAPSQISCIAFTKVCTFMAVRSAALRPLVC